MTTGTSRRRRLLRCLARDYIRTMKLAIYFENWWYIISVVSWGFLTNHARVLLRIAHDPGARLRDIAASLGITERSPPAARPGAATGP